jgi:phosphate transport system protein
LAVTLRHQFDTDLESLQQDVLRMGTYVVEMLDLAVQALSRQDARLAEQVIDMDDTADEMDVQIEQTCLRLLALQQPMSKDLRIISAALKIITDLERIGDFSVDIAKTARRMAREVYFQPLTEIEQMAKCTRALVHESLQAYIRQDLVSVRRAVQMDDEIDDWYDEIFTDLMRQAERDPARYRQAVWLTHVTHFLERIADHAVNVAERVSYMVTGEFRQLAPSHGGGDQGAGGRV